jgi:hypothetical protein
VRRATNSTLVVELGADIEEAQSLPWHEMPDLTLNMCSKTRQGQGRFAEAAGAGRQVVDCGVDYVKCRAKLAAGEELQRGNSRQHMTYGPILTGRGGPLRTQQEVRFTALDLTGAA